MGVFWLAIATSMSSFIGKTCDVLEEVTGEGMYIYIYTYVCVCVCVFVLNLQERYVTHYPHTHAHTHTHTHTECDVTVGASDKGKTLGMVGGVHTGPINTGVCV
jgi:hypothetical protein